MDTRNVGNKEKGSNDGTDPTQRTGRAGPQSENTGAERSKKILAVMQAPINNGRQQMETLRDKAIKWMATFRTAKLGKETAWHAVNTRIMKGLEWPMTVTTMLQEQCNKVMTPYPLGWTARM